MSKKKTVPEKGIKHDGNKIRFELISPLSLKELAMILTNGAKKYSDRNWEKGINVSRLLGAINRHMNAIQLGEIIDPEDGLTHAGKMLAETMFLHHFILAGRLGEVNDLPKYFYLNYLRPENEYNPTRIHELHCKPVVNIKPPSKKKR